MSKKIRFKNYTKEELTEAIKNSLCWTDVCRMLSVTVCTTNFKRVQALVEAFGLSIAHFNPKSAFARGKHYWTHEEMLVEKSKVHRSVLRDYIRRHSVIEEKCSECSLKKEWNNKPIVLEIDHINGHSDDNRIENLRMLCPNCHSQTKTERAGGINPHDSPLSCPPLTYTI